MAKVLKPGDRLTDFRLVTKNNISYNVADLYSDNDCDLDKTAGAIASLVNNNRDNIYAEATFYDTIGQDLHPSYSVKLTPYDPSGMDSDTVVAKTNCDKPKLILKQWRCVRGGNMVYDISLHPKSHNGEIAYIQAASADPAISNK